MRKGTLILPDIILTFVLGLYNVLCTYIVMTDRALVVNITVIMIIFLVYFTPVKLAFGVDKINNKLNFCMELGNIVRDHLSKVPKNPRPAS